MAFQHFDLSDLYRQIGIVIRMARKGKNYSQIDLGAMIFLSKTTVSAIELGRRGLDARRIVLICDALDITPNMLFGYEELEKGDPLLDWDTSERWLLTEIAEALGKYLRRSNRK